LALAVEQYDARLRKSGKEIPETVWRTDQTVGIEMINLHVQRDEITAAKQWIDRLVKHFDIDVRALTRVHEIANCSALTGYLKLKWSFTKEHHLLANCFTAKNESRFSVTGLVVSVQYTLRGGTRRSFQKQTSRLGPGKTERWEGVFSGAGIFGSEIIHIEVNAVSNQGRLQLTGTQYPEQLTKICPQCGNLLATPLAQQCFRCGADWH